jgi:hypothetical protein
MRFLDRFGVICGESVHHQLSSLPLCSIRSDSSQLKFAVTRASFAITLSRIEDTDILTPLLLQNTLRIKVIKKRILFIGTMMFLKNEAAYAAAGTDFPDEEAFPIADNANS